MRNKLHRFWLVIALVAFAPVAFAAGYAVSKAITVTTSPTLMLGETGVQDRAAIIYNNGSVTVYAGGRTVSTTTGVPIAAGAAITISGGASVYGVTSSSTANVRVMEAYP